MRASEAVLLTLNKVFPARKIAGRASLDDYSRAQYDWAANEWKYFSPHITLEGRTVLDAGCGRGGKTAFYAEHGPAAIVGYELSAASLEQARKFAGERNLTNVRFVQGSLHEMPFDDDSFDVIFLNDVLEHIVRPILEDALRELRRVLRPGGALCLNFPPWTSHDAAHLYDTIHVLWPQFLFSDETLLSVSRRIDPENFAHTERVFLELNRLTIDEFEELIGRLGFTVRHLELDTIKSIRLFSRFRSVNKYLTRRVVAILSKPEAKVNLDPESPAFAGSAESGMTVGGTGNT